ncbi:MAG TPA: glycosyltransferase [Bacteroidales bacterium]|nr:glycosyltransferase [Bacteroidales bacterium]
MNYSIIIPVYNRPEEVEELLESLKDQHYQDFEVLIVEDGSQVPCREVVERYADILPVRYFQKDNEGPGPTRNYGAERAEGEYLLFFDSDCLIPRGYLGEVDRELLQKRVDAFGGPDASHPSFKPIQKAISYSMTSFFTTGGIRGGKEKMDRFYPRSFNMGITREVFLATGGFSRLRFGEDLDFSIRIIRQGYTTRLFPGAFVYHKRRTNFRQFFKQVYNSGIARINLHKRHKGTLKLVHLLPALFTLGSLLLMLLAFFNICFLFPLLIFALLILVDASLQYKSLRIGMFSIAAGFIQLFGYGLGFMKAFRKRILMNKKEFHAYERNFYD